MTLNTNLTVTLSFYLFDELFFRMKVLNHKFNVLSGVNREKFTDLKLVTECGNSILVHKVIAVAASQSLNKRVSSNSITELPVRNVKFSALKNLFDFIYEGKILLPSSAELEDLAAAYKILNINLGKKINNIVDSIVSEVPNSDVESSCEETPDLMCKNCDKRFDDKTKFNRHIKEVHKKEQSVPRPKYSCEKCGAVYTVSIIKQNWVTFM